MYKIFLKKKYKLFQQIIFIINITSLIINLCFYKINRRKCKYFDSKLFKSSDDFIMKLNTKEYKDISRYLNNKYSINNKVPSKFQFFKKVVRIKIVGLFDRLNHIRWLKSKTDDEFILIFVENNPDYLIYNVFTQEDIKQKYNNVIKIAIYTENIMPDLNLADYAIGHYHINYLDRYFKYNVFFWTNFNEIDKKRKEILGNPIRKKFCGAVISNCSAIFRLDFIHQLNKYKKVDMGGKCQNNINESVIDKVAFLSGYKFSIAIENSDGDGYLSEKIVDSFLAGTIPIYYGDYLLDEFINPKSFILIKGEQDIEKKIEYIKKIDEDDDLYRSIIMEKPIIDDNFANKIDEMEIKSFLKHIFKQDKNKAFRRDDNYYKFKENYIFLSLNLKFLLISLFFL